MSAFRQSVVADSRRKVEKVDQTMDAIREQMDLTNEISDAISNPVGMGNMVDEVSAFFYSAIAFPSPQVDLI